MDQKQIVDAVSHWLDHDDWHYDYNAEKHMFKMGISLKSKLQSGRIFVDVKEDCYVVYIYAPISGKDNLAELTKYLTMANYGLLNGNFELDVDDGEIRYKTYVNCDGLRELSSAVIEDSIYVGCVMMDRYGDGIAALALGFSDADTEIKKAEKKDESSAS